MINHRNSLFLINSGNTNVQYALVQNGQIGKVYSVSSHDFAPDVIPPDTPVAIACVNPVFMAKLQNIKAVFKLDAGINCGIDFSRCDVSTLGADRLANVIELADSGPLPAVCIDFGTAITFEVLGPGRIFYGGAIMPGRMIQRKALHDYTALLPQIGFYEDIPACGCNTVDALRIGVDEGVIGSVERIIGKIKKMFPGEQLRAVATGGDSDFFLKNISGLEAGGKYCTLYGIRKAWEYHINES